ncbi:bromodomain-containing protein 8 isoform X3 [Hemicordylus capensis]|uniref:bromodomain-containing protein 8 isoform X3 n=1 Tax=Hemicordylus capensis TaxID=884348 RepID=UPI0023040B2A|nr:bromodomain-containing protein 8 isoform X3 [Hemicordylus capensis]
MAAGTGKHKLLSAGPTEPWSIREKLCLASSVMRSGDQNWVSVSRAIKPFAEPGRPPDWFSQKHCASQYSELLETTETPKRKRGEKGEVVETVEDVIVRKLTAERVEELKKLIKETQEKYRQLKRDAELIQAGHMDHRLEELYNDILVKKRMEEEEAEVKRKATDAAYQARQAVKNPSRRLPGMMVRSPAGSTSPGTDYTLGDLSQPTVEEASPGVTPGTLPSTPVASFIGIPDTPMGSTSLDAPMTPVTDDSAQKKMLGQKATPPPSPLLSELLKKGSLLPTSPRLVGESDITVVSGHTSTSGILLEVGGVLPVLHGGEMQSASTTVPASPAASGAPTLSRLLEAGPAQFTTSLASFSAVASEPPAKLLPPPVESVSQATIVMVPTLPAPAAVLPAATPESVATGFHLTCRSCPVSQSNTCVSMEAVPDPHTVTVSMDSSEISMIIDSFKKDCRGSGASGAVGTSKDHSMDGKEDLDLTEKMDIAVSYTGEEPSYTGEELDFDTVGDIIAIIEDKVDDHPEVLDPATVEAALSFCEEIGDSQSLTGPWEHPLQQELPLQQEHEKPNPIPQMAVTVKQERSDCEESEVKGIRDLMNIGDLGTEIKPEPVEQEQIHLGSEDADLLASRTSEAPELRGQIPQDEETQVAGLESSEMEMESAKDEMDHGTVKTELPPDDETSSPHAPSASEDSSQADLHHKYELSESMKEETQALFGNQMKGEEDDEDGASEAASLEEPKEEDQGEGYLSEIDNEPPVSESDDGFSIHNAPLQSHTLADSIPSSPASSQFSVCSEDQEAIQAQKIWKKAIMLVWRAAANHRYANVFLQPVTDDIAPGYHSIVQRPMDLSTIKKNIENGLIRTTAEFQRDIMLMFQNAVMYNSSDHDVYHMAVEMQRDVLEQIQQFLATQLIMQTSESGISAKSLRGRDSTRKQDASEKDSVPMGSPAFLLSLFMGHVWTWLESKGEIFTDSEKSSYCPSLGSPDSSSDLDLDLEIGSWRKSIETADEELEESSSQEEDSQLETSDTLAWERDSQVDQEEAARYKQDALLKFLSEVTHLMEPLSIGSTYLAQGSQTLSAGEQKGWEDLTHRRGTWGSSIPKEEKVGEESQLQVLKEKAGERAAPKGKENLALQVSGLPIRSWEAEEMEELQDLCEETGDSPTQCSRLKTIDRDSGEKVLHVLVESTEGRDEDEEYSFELMNRTSFTWRTLEEEFPKSIKEVSVEHPEEQVEDWKDSDFHLSNSNDDSSPCGTPPMSSPSTSTASLPLMQLSQDDPLEQQLLFKKTLMSIWKMVAGHRYSGPFLKPVSEKQAPGYKDVVKRPIDLSTIKRSLSKGQIQNMVQFQRDLMLMFQNAVMYNSFNHHIHRIAVEMQREVLEQLQMLGEALLCSEEMCGFMRRISLGTELCLKSPKCERYSPQDGSRLLTFSVLSRVNLPECLKGTHMLFLMETMYGPSS